MLKNQSRALRTVGIQNVGAISYPTGFVILGTLRSRSGTDGTAFFVFFFWPVEQVHLQGRLTPLRMRSNLRTCRAYAQWQRTGLSV